MCSPAQRPALKLRRPRKLRGALCPRDARGLHSQVGRVMDQLNRLPQGQFTHSAFPLDTSLNHRRRRHGMDPLVAVGWKLGSKRAEPMSAGQPVGWAWRLLTEAATVVHRAMMRAGVAL